MRWPTLIELRRSARLLFVRDRVESEWREELEYHAEMRARELVDQGVDASEAIRRARTEMGGEIRLRQDLTEVHGRSFASAIDDVMGDVRLGMRRIRRAPGFAAAVIVSIAIAIAANAIVFSAVRGLLVRPMPVADVDRLVWVSSVRPADASSGGLDDWEAEGLSRHREVFGSVAVIGDRAFVRHAGDVRRRWHGLWVTPGLFDVLQVSPALGRRFDRSDVSAGAKAILISHERWQIDFGGDSTIIGRTLDFIDRKSFVVVGILPPSLEFPFGRPPRSGNGSGYRAGVQDFWILGQDRPELPGGTVIARLAKDATLGDAARAAELVSRRRPIESDSTRRLAVASVREQAVGIAGKGVALAQAFAVLLLLLATANLANMVMLRLRGRSTELSVLAALGASRRTITRTLVVETALLLAAGIGLGFATSFLGRRVMLWLAAGSAPLLERIQVDWEVATGTAAAAAFLVLAVAVVPALLATRGVGNSRVASSGRMPTAGRELHRFRVALVMVQVALAFVLSVGAGLIATSFQRLMSVDTGYERSGVIAAEVEVFDHPNVVEYYQALDRRLRSIPGVEAVGVIHSTPLTGKWSFGDQFEVVGRAYGAAGAPRVSGSFVAFDYFGAMRIPILAGRAFTEAEYTQGDAAALIINESAARRFFPDGTALDQSVRIAGKPRRIVGIVKDSRDVRLDAEAEPLWYQPLFFGGNQLMVRVAGTAESMVPVVRKALLESDRGVLIESIGPFDEIVGGTVAERRMAMRLVSVFAALSLALAVAGLYGVLSHGVRQRRREIGVRAALGAPRSRLLRDVITEGMGMTAGGLAVGIVAAVAATRVLASLLYNVDPLDTSTFAGIAAILAVTALAAGVLPGISAMRTDPAIALRED